MTPTYFEGAIEIQKPQNMTDEECSPLWATAGIDAAGYCYYLTAWLPNYEDIKAINEGRPIMVKTLAKQLPPMALFTLDEKNEGNF